MNGDEQVASGRVDILAGGGGLDGFSHGAQGKIMTQEDTKHTWLMAVVPSVSRKLHVRRVSRKQNILAVSKLCHTQFNDLVEGSTLGAMYV